MGGSEVSGLAAKRPVEEPEQRTDGDHACAAYPERLSRHLQRTEPPDPAESGREGCAVSRRAHPGDQLRQPLVEPNLGTPAE